MVTHKYGLGGRVFLPGDADQALALTASASTSAIHKSVCIYDAPLTADRAVTLSTARVPAGLQWRVVRTANATGAVVVNVGSGPLAALDTGRWADLVYTGAAWVLAGAGAL